VTDRGGTEALDRLPAGTRRRLQAFASRLERMRLSDLPVYAANAIEPGHAKALTVAHETAVGNGLEQAVKQARATIAAYVERQFADGLDRPWAHGLNWGLDGGLGRADDRVRVMKTLGDATTALVLWDLLGEDVRDEILGPWAALTT
jgi:hypothetical protein